MGDKIVVGPINQGLRKDRTAFVIDNDSFPTLTNAYQWRGRIKRKRGTALIGRLSRYIGTTDGLGAITVTILPIPIAAGIASFTIGGEVFVDGGGASPVTLTTNSGGGTHTLDRATGVLTITGSNPLTPVIYYPRLPVMGIEDFTIISTQYPLTLLFDTRYSYNLSTSSPYTINDVSFYKNPPNGTYPLYVAKGTWTPVSWNGQDYQQFYTVNYQDALWATNGVNVPFVSTQYGMQFQKVTAPAVTAATTDTVTFTLGANPLVIGDFVFVNEFTSAAAVTPPNSILLNQLTGYVIATGAGTVDVKFPNAAIPADTYTGGLLQFLTNRSSTTRDCIRWYDGDPTNGSATAPVFGGSKGWVNFMPPLSRDNFSIADLPAAQYYLVGARLIAPFKDRLLFLGPIVQTSSGEPIYLQDTVVYSQNGTPYYTATFAADPTLVTTPFFSVLVPTNQTATVSAWWEDQTGFGGFITAGVEQPIVTSSSCEDVLILGFTNLQTKLVYSGNDIVPFNFFLINSELGSGSTFSAINMDRGVLTRGLRGFIITGQTEARRFDLDIPDQNFEINLENNGAERVCSQRDFVNEWVYFTYPQNNSAAPARFPNQTLLYNYRDDSWGIFNESYTTYGNFQRGTGYTWNTIGTEYESWEEWNDPWNAGTTTLLQQQVLAGNQQGFILEKDAGTGEGASLTINAISASIVTSPNHGLNAGDYIIITGCLGTVSSQVNGKIFSVNVIDGDTFRINPPLNTATYLGGGLITRMYVPFIQTKQFPVAWDMARKTRLGPQQYLLTRTDNGEIQLLIFISQVDLPAYNEGSIVPQNFVLNSALVYSTNLFTCPESTNLGLTTYTKNLQTPTASQQKYLWHRMNTSLIGDTVQVGFTMSDTQMREFANTDFTLQITGATQANPCVLSCLNVISTGLMVKVTGVVGMTELNYDGTQNTIYQVIARSATTVTIDVDSSAFTPYSNGGIVTIQNMPNQFEEIELHSIILDVSPSQMLV